MKKSLLIFLCCISITAFAQNDITWNMGMNLANNTYSNMHPRMSLDGDGNPLVVWGRMSDQAVFFSRWNGTAFTTPVKLNPSWLSVATASWMGPDIASHGDTVYVVVKRTPEASDTNHIFIFTSFNGGVSFNNPVELAIIGDSLSRFHTVTTDATGKPIVAYMKFNSSFGDSRWVVTKSTDYGTNFSIDKKASGWAGSAEVCDCCPGALVSEGNTCAMLYRNNNNNIRDTWTGISSNNASTFTTGFALENHNWMQMSCPSSGPDGVIIGDTLYSIFMNGAIGGFRVYISKSLVSNNTLVSTIGITGSIPGLSQQNYPRIASDGYAMAIVWKQSVSGVAQLPVLFTNDITTGFPAAYDTVDLGDITNADVALGNGKIFVVWQDDNAGTVKYRSGTYTSSTTGLAPLVSEENSLFELYPNPVVGELNIISSAKEVFSATIFNSYGQKIISETATSKIKLNTSGLIEGSYFVQFISGDKMATRKFIKK